MWCQFLGIVKKAHLMFLTCHVAIFLGSDSVYIILFWQTTKINEKNHCTKTAHLLHFSFLNIFLTFFSFPLFLVRFVIWDLSSVICDLRFVIWDSWSEIQNLRFVIWDSRSDFPDLRFLIGDSWSEIRDLSFVMWDLRSEIRDLRSEIWDLRSENRDLRYHMWGLGS